MPNYYLPFTTVKVQTLEHFTINGRDLYKATKDLIDQMNLDKIIKENASLFRKLSNPKKKKGDVDTLLKRIITMFLPEH